MEPINKITLTNDEYMTEIIGHIDKIYKSYNISTPSSHNVYTPEEFINIIHALLTTKEKYTIEQMYRYRTNTKDIASALDVSTNRIYQIRNKAIRKISERMLSSNEAFVNNLDIDDIFSDDKYIEMRDELKNILESFPELHDTLSSIMVNGRSYDDAKAILCKILSLKIISLNISIRAHTALRFRGKCGYIIDIYKMTPPEFTKVYTFGTVSQNEVINEMRKLGFTAWADNMIKYVR